MVPGERQTPLSGSSKRKVVERTIRDIPVEVPLDQSDGLPLHCVANLDDLTTVPKSCIKRRIATLSADKIRLIEHAIRFALDLS